MKHGSKGCLRAATVLLTVGMIFFANPMWTLTDVLPDLIGWALVWFGLRELASLNDNMTTARRWTLYLALIGLLKPIGGNMLSGSLYPSDSMLAVTLFSAGEIVCMSLFFGAFLRGAEELSRAGGCDRMYLGIGNVKFFCVLFTWTRGICTLLPELVAIPDWLVRYGGESLAGKSEGFVVFLRNVAESKELFLVVASTLELIVACVWLVKFLPFLRLFRSDASFNGFIADRLGIDGDAIRLSARIGTLRAAKRVAAVGIVFLADFQSDSVRFLPMAGMPLLLAASCLLYDRFAGEKRLRGSALRLAVAGGFLILAELYRRFFTVWDMAAYEELELPTALVSAAVALVGSALLLYAFLSFSAGMDGFALRNGKGTPDLAGLPYALLTLYCVTQTLSFVLPLWNRYLTFPRLLLTAGIWIVVVGRLSAMTEQTEQLLSLYPERGKQLDP